MIHHGADLRASHTTLQGSVDRSPNWKHFKSSCEDPVGPIQRRPRVNRLWYVNGHRSITYWTHEASDNPIANGFLITDGHTTITVPKVPDGNYLIVCELQSAADHLKPLTTASVFGNSGDTSPQFKIVNNPLSSILGGSGSSHSPTPTPQDPPSPPSSPSK